jgi:hypothetical protein
MACNPGAHIYFVYYIYLYIYFVYGNVIWGIKYVILFSLQLCLEISFTVMNIWHVMLKVGIEMQVGFTCVLFIFDFN